MKNLERKGLHDELQSLTTSGSALGDKLVRFRANAAETLGLNPDDLPFLGEMWEVQEDDWKGGCEPRSR